MIDNFLFITIFLAQILIVSYYLPGRIRNRIRHVFITCPPDKYPNLYPKPVEYYQLALQLFWGVSLAILVAGLVILFVLVVKSPDLSASNPERWDQALVTAWFFVQMLPMVLLEIGVMKYYRAMRETNPKTTRTAALRPRRLFDFISPIWIGSAILAYVAFAAFIVYMRQFNYPWFGGYANIVGVTFANLLFAGVVAWNMYGKKLNPHQANEDRMKEIRLVAKQMAFMSIAITLHVTLSIALATWDSRHLQGPIMSLFYQLIALIAFQTVRTENIDFEVYKGDSLVRTA